MDENHNSKVHSIKILLVSGASVSIARRDFLHKRHRTLKAEKNRWCTMVGFFDITSATELKVNLSKLNHADEIYAKCHL